VETLFSGLFTLFLFWTRFGEADVGEGVPTTLWDIELTMLVYTV
jgi:hypothetical protein